MEHPNLGEIVAPFPGVKYCPPSGAVYLAVSKNEAKFQFLEKPPSDIENWEIISLNPGYGIIFHRCDKHQCSAGCWFEIPPLSRV